MIQEKNDILGYVAVVRSGKIVDSLPFYDEGEALDIFLAFCRFYIDADYKMDKYTFYKKHKEFDSGFIEIWYF